MLALELGFLGRPVVSAKLRTRYAKDAKGLIPSRATAYRSCAIVDVEASGNSWGTVQYKWWDDEQHSDQQPPMAGFGE
jgi:hypothetical protein